MSKTKILKCGCAANARRKEIGWDDFKDSCSLHGNTEVAEVQPDLSKREMKCGCCSKTLPSDSDEAFFEYNGDKKDYKGNVIEFDRFYCGCRGWN